MKAKYDIARLHKDCLAWCENPTWKPWMVAETIYINRTKDSFIVKNDDAKLFTLYFDLDWSLEHPSFLFQKASVIGLDVESYRLPEIDRDQAVRDYLDSIPSGGELADGWIKTVSLHTGATFAEKSANIIRLMNADKVVDPIAYTFLRLDLRKDGK